MVRKLGIHGGDMAVLNPDPANYKNYTGRLPQVTIVDVSADPEPNIVREKAIVESAEDGTLVAKYDYNHEPLLMHGEPTTIKLDEDDVRRNHVSEGDLIELAYYTSNESNEARVTWKYDTDEPETDDTITKPHSAYVEKGDTKVKAFQPNMDYDLTNKKSSCVVTEVIVRWLKK